MGPDTESRISRDVSDQLATPSEIFAQLRDDQEISMTIAPVEEVNEFLNDFSNDIFDVEAVGNRASRSGTGCRQSRRYATLMSKRPG